MMSKFKLIYKIYFFFFYFFLFFIFYNSNLYSNNNIGINHICGDSLNDIELKDLEILNIKINKSSKWFENIVKASLSKKEYISEKFKKNYSADIDFNLKNKISCKSKAKIRINGDLKDHLDISNPNNIAASLDVTLLDGNIENVVKFKLFLPETKNARNTIIFRSILEELGFFKKREQLINVNVNGRTKQYLFSEKYTKEFLEYNSLREGPIITSAEDLLWQDEIKRTDYFLNNIYNYKWSEKNQSNFAISTESLNLLNAVYLDYHIQHDYFNQYHRFDLNFNMFEDLGYDISHLRKLEILYLAFNARHGLFVNNRKYYFDPLYKKFYALSYDEMPIFGIAAEQNFESPQIYFPNKYINTIIDSIKVIDKQNLIKKLEKKNIYITDVEITQILNDAIKNLNLTINHNQNNIKKQKFEKKEFKDYFSSIEDYEYEKIFNDENFNLISCISFNNCTKFTNDLSINSKILGGKKIKKTSNSLMQYIGDKNFYYNSQFEELYKSKLKSIKKDDLNFLYEEGVIINIDEQNKIVKIFEKNKKKRVVVYNSKIKDYKFKYYGSEESTLELGNDKNNLTGCLNFYDNELKNISIEINSSNCEDGVNFVRNKGSIENISVYNSSSDAIDFDFSDVYINNISVVNSKNDCTDFSYGNYRINKISTELCGDKSTSVGEKSKVQILEIKDYKSITTIAVKDSSFASVENLISNESYNCGLAYRKKQEFVGGVLNINNHKCDGKFHYDKGSLIKF